MQIERHRIDRAPEVTRSRGSHLWFGRVRRYARERRPVASSSYERLRDEVGGETLDSFAPVLESRLRSRAIG